MRLLYDACVKFNVYTDLLTRFQQLLWFIWPDLQLWEASRGYSVHVARFKTTQRTFFCTRAVDPQLQTAGNWCCLGPRLPVLPSLCSSYTHAIGSCVAFEQGDLTQSFIQSVEDQILTYLWVFSREGHKYSIRISKEMEKVFINKAIRIVFLTP